MTRTFPTSPFRNLIHDVAKTQQDPLSLERKFMETIVDRKAREVFTEFAAQYPRLISNSPLLNKISRAARQLDRQEGKTIPRSFFELTGLATLGNLLSDWALSYSSEFERVLLADPSSLKNYLETKGENKAISPIQCFLLFEYIETGIVDVEALDPPLDKLLAIRGFSDLMVLQERDNLTASIPMMKKLAVDNPNLLIRILSNLDSDGFTILHDDCLINSLTPLFDDLVKTNPDLLLTIFSIRNAHDDAPLFLTENYKAFLPWLEKTAEESPALVLQLLSITDDENNLLLLNEKSLQASVNLLTIAGRHKPNLLVDLLATRNRYGYTLLNYSRRLPLLLPVMTELKEINPQSPAKILSIKDNKGNTVFNFLPSNFAPTLAWIRENYSNDPNGILHIISQQPDFFKYAVLDLEAATPVLEIMAETDEGKRIVTNWLCERDKNDETLLHNSRILIKSGKLIELCGIDLSALKDKIGLTPTDTYQLSSKWLALPKTGVANIPDLTDEEYRLKAEEIEKGVFDLWEDLKFGYEIGDQFPTTLILKKKLREKDAEGKFVRLSPEAIEERREEVRKYLEALFSLIKDKKAFLGTPRADQPRELKRFYTQIMLNIETVVTAANKRKDSQYTASALCGLAKASASERCAARYQGVTSQQAEYAQEEDSDLTLEDVIHSKSKRTFKEFINLLADKHYKADSHGNNQLNYVAGFLLVPDPLSHDKPEYVENLVLTSFKLSKFILGIQEKLPQTIPSVPHSYLLSLTPDEFDGGYLKYIQEAKEREMSVIEAAAASLAKWFSPEQMESALRLAKNSPGPDFLNIISLETFTDTVLFARTAFHAGIDAINRSFARAGIGAFEYRLLPDFPTKKDIAQLSKALEMHIAAQIPSQSYPQKPENPTEEELKSYQEAVKKFNSAQMAIIPKRRNAVNAQKDLIELISTAIDFQKSMAENKMTRVEDYKAILKERNTLREELKKIADEISESIPEDSSVDASFNPKAGELFSETLDNRRRVEYNKEWLDSGIKTLLKSLEAIGILEKPV